MTNKPSLENYRVALGNRPSLAISHPDLARQWHPTKNGTISPSVVSSGSDLRAWWRCDANPNHVWDAPVNRRAKGKGLCPFCAGRRVSPENSLAVLRPKLATEWLSERNGALSPHDVTCSMTRKVWWRCSKDSSHIWEAAIYARAIRGNGCPWCAGRQVRELVSEHPELVAQWHPTKNGRLRPSELNIGSTRKVWWSCPVDPSHVWSTSPVYRVERGRGCPYCAGVRVGADNNLAVRFPDLAKQWHPTRNAKKPEEVLATSSKKAWWICSKNPNHVWEAIVANRSRQGKGCPYCANLKVAEDNNLAVLYPDVAASWHPTLNAPLSPRDVVGGSTREFWWTCDKGPDHVWKTSVVNRVNHDCPFCAGMKVAPSNCFERKHPVLAAQWHPTKNGELKPWNVTSGSSKLVWWQCSENSEHVWQAKVEQRVKRPACPFCAGNRASAENSLATRHPVLAKEWHPTRNKPLRPSDVLPGTHREVWWRCSKGHEWRASVEKRVHGSVGCPVCGRSRKRAKSLAVLEPEIAAEWHTERNGDLRPEDVARQSNKNVWWQCRHDASHVWQNTVQSRTALGIGCPYCSGRRASASNSLAATHPALVEQWHPTLNSELTPQDVTHKSVRDVWWQCPKHENHVWKARVRNRAAGIGCPFCSNKRVSRENSLAAKRPDIAAQWHPTKNHPLTPWEVTPGSSKKVWWQCTQGHEWRATVANRNSGRGCAYCSGKRVHEAASVASVHPELVDEWHPTKNDDFTPDRVRATTRKVVWWECSEGHEWRASPYARAKGGGDCPQCREARRAEEKRQRAQRSNRRPIATHAKRGEGMYLGVTLLRSGSRAGAFKAQVMVDGKYHSLGTWDAERDAATAWDRAALYFDLKVELNLEESRELTPASPDELQFQARMLHKANNKVSKYAGIYRDYKQNDWIGYVSYGGRTHFLGGFQKAEDAARARDRVALHLWGSDASLNFPEEELEPATIGEMRTLARSLKSDRTSPYWGVHSEDMSKPNPWLATLALPDRRRRQRPGNSSAYFLGCWFTQKEAAVAHDRAALYYLKDPERLNFADQRESLVPASAKQLQAEARRAYKRQYTSSRFRGVCFSKTSGLWVAVIGVGGKRRTLGSFVHEEAAAQAYDDAATDLLGELAVLNFHPKTGEPLYGERLGGPDIVRRGRKR